MIVHYLMGSQILKGIAMAGVYNSNNGNKIFHCYVILQFEYKLKRQKTI